MAKELAVLPNKLFKPYKRKEIHGGVQYLFRFPNGLGASVVRHSFSYGNEDGLWELAVVKFSDDGSEWSITYNTEVTGDVLGHLTEDRVFEILSQINNLKREV